MNDEDDEIDDSEFMNIVRIPLNLLL